MKSAPQMKLNPPIRRRGRFHPQRGFHRRRRFIPSARVDLVEKSTPKRAFFVVPLTGLEPVQYRYRGILSPLCLPIPPQRQLRGMVSHFYPFVKGNMGKLRSRQRIAYISFILRSTRAFKLSGWSQKQVAPASTSSWRLRKPHRTLMQGTPAFWAVFRSTSLSPT